MSVQDRDYLMRLIRQISQAIARIAGLKSEGKIEEALLVVEETCDGVFGPLRRALQEIDSRTGASLLGNREKIHAYAVLVAQQGELLALRKDRQAASLHRRALEYFLEEVLLVEDPSADTRMAVALLRPKVEETKLSQRYREALARL